MNKKATPSALNQAPANPLIGQIISAQANGNRTLLKRLLRKALNQKKIEPKAFALIGEMALLEKLPIGTMLIQRAYAHSPSNPDVASAYAAMLRDQGNIDKAIALMIPVCIKNPMHRQSHRFLGFSYMETESFELAKPYLQSCLKHYPSDALCWEHMGQIYLYQNQTESAISALKRARLLKPNRARTLSYLALALQLHGDEVGFDALCPAAAIRETPLEFPEGFLPKLTTYIQSKGLLTEPGPHKATVGGQQSPGNLFDDPEGKAFQALLPFLIKPIELFRKAQQKDFPLSPLQPPQKYRLSAWAVSLTSGGYQKPHIHESGWVSNVLYISLPATVSATDTQDGCLEFGTVPALYQHGHKIQGKRLKTITPREGLCVSFPSYYWHSTRPFQSAKPRLCIAFDAIGV